MQRKTQNWKNGKWIDALSLSTDKPSMEHCEYQKQNDYLHSCSTRTQSWCCTQFNLVFVETGTVELDTTHTGSPSNYLENGLWAGGLSLRSTRHTCFFSILNPQNPSSRQRTIGWTRPIHEPRMTLYKQSNRPDHVQSTTSSRRKFGISSKLQ